MIVNVYRDELYPYFMVYDNGYGGVAEDLPTETIEWIQQTLKEFDKVQDLLGSIYYGNYA